MKCENCKKNEANIFISNRINDKEEKHCLCTECASKLGYPPFKVASFGGDAYKNVFIPASDVIKSVFGMLNLPSVLERRQSAKENTESGAVYSDTVASLKERKEKNEKAIAALTEEIRKLEKENMEIVAELQKKDSVEEKIKALRNEMREAIENEDFEKAAEIRDKIKDIKK